MGIKNWVIISLILIATLLVGTFYWFSWRPEQIRKNCFKEAAETYFRLKDQGSISGQSKEAVNYLYQVCLVKNGLKSEAILK